jgi:tartrate dehydrogenase/decarboxylase/D-malate dehydrogenase
MANPVGAIWSGAILLETLGEKAASEDIVDAIEHALGSGIKTIDLGGKAKTVEITDAILSNI